MKPFIQRVLQAYRPLYMNGLFKDGRCLGTAEPARPPPSRSRAFLLALTHAMAASKRRN